MNEAIQYMITRYQQLLTSNVNNPYYKTLYDYQYAIQLKINELKKIKT